MNVNPSVMAVRPGKGNLAALFCWLISRRSHFAADINHKMSGTPQDWRGLALSEVGGWASEDSDHSGLPPSAAILLLC